MKRRDFLGVALVGAATPRQPGTPGKTPPPRGAAPIAPPGALDELTVAELQAAMVSGELTARQLGETYLRRILEVDSSAGGVNAVLELNPEALLIADDRDRERRAGRVRGPLHGIPVMIKDNIDTADRMTTTAGSLALAGSRASRDAFIVDRLRVAGAVLLGKTNLSEWANYRSRRSSSGWSGRGRQTRNPWALDRNPCGSSSGSAAAVSANLCAVTIGTETDGSIVCPSSANGVVGLKPTVGLWSRSGIIPISATQDTAGPMGRTVADVAVLLGPLTGRDPTDPRSVDAEGQGHADYGVFLDRDGLRGRRIGVLRSAFGFHEAVDAIMADALATMRGAGAVIIDPVEINAPRGVGGWERTVLSYEFKDGVNRYLAGLGNDAPVRSLADVIAFNAANAEASMPYFGQETLIAAQARGGLDAAEYREAREQMLGGARTAGIDATLAEHRLDAVVAPTGGPAWVTDLVTGDHFGGGSSGHAARAGYPNISVPAGYVHGLPVGLSLFSTAWREPDLLAMAYAFEQASGVRQPPPLVPTLDLA
jgi:amidase